MDSLTQGHPISTLLHAISSTLHTIFYFLFSVYFFLCLLFDETEIAMETWNSETRLILILKESITTKTLIKITILGKFKLKTTKKTRYYSMPLYLFYNSKLGFGGAVCLFPAGFLTSGSFIFNLGRLKVLAPKCSWRFLLIIEARGGKLGLECLFG